MDQKQTENEKLLARRHWKLINCPRVCLPGVGIYSGNVSQCSCLVVKGRGRERECEHSWHCIHVQFHWVQSVNGIEVPSPAHKGQERETCNGL